MTEVTFDRKRPQAQTAEEEIAAKKTAKCVALGDFMGGDVTVNYEDLETSEVYTLTRADGEVLVLTACGNRFDGGWLEIE